ncbi:MAG TPA: RDD family protein [Flavisolibacter sp.]|jgi:uncharacterized RDD family membrane protein YckC
MDILSDALPQPELARKRIRVAAFLVDLIIFWLIAFLVGRLLGEQDTIYTETTDTSATLRFRLTGVPALIMLVVWFLQFPLVEGVTGQTMGKKLFGLRVEKKDLTPMSVGASFVRHILMPIDMFLIGLIVASTNKDRQRIGDLVAKTIVIKAGTLRPAQA